jgi:hypothetical protein
MRRCIWDSPVPVDSHICVVAQKMLSSVPYWMALASTAVYSAKQTCSDLRQAMVSAVEMAEEDFATLALVG